MVRDKPLTQKWYVSAKTKRFQGAQQLFTFSLQPKSNRSAAQQLNMLGFVEQTIRLTEFNQGKMHYDEALQRF